MEGDLKKATELRDVLAKVRRSLVPQLDLVSTIRPLGSLGQITRIQQSFLAIGEKIREDSAALVSAKKFINWSDVFSRQSETLRVLNLNTSITESLQRRATHWQNAIESMGKFAVAPSLADQFSRSALTWNTSLSETIRRITETGNLEIFFASRMLEPTFVHTKFAEDTLSLLSESSSQKLSNALNASLNLANAQRIANAELLFGLGSTSNDVESYSIEWQLNSPYIQREELLSESEIEDSEDLELVVAQSPAAQESEQTRTMLLLATDCNKASRTKGSVEIFKPTNKVLEVYGNLPWLTPHDEKSFGELVDGLYFIAYQAAGKDKLRYHKDHGGPLSGEHCEVIWCIKTLRNKWLRHDVDHGKEADIDKSWKTLDEYFRWLGLGGFPRSSSDYRTLHRQLLAKMNDFFERLLQAI